LLKYHVRNNILNKCHYNSITLRACVIDIQGGLGSTYVRQGKRIETSREGTTLKIKRRWEDDRLDLREV